MCRRYKTSHVESVMDVESALAQSSLVGVVEKYGCGGYGHGLVTGVSRVQRGSTSTGWFGVVVREGRCLVT
ncbi:hypothetical protein TNCV_3632601 [Trichonephila clavipes]|nr:hypothetical protein TNCV_3632601 [Trichonephila clavipes]